MRRQNLIIAVITALVACQLDSSWALQCYKCTGQDCNFVAATMLTACAGDSKCYTTGTGAYNMTRGCTADTTATYKCPADSTDPSCAICEAEQCNNFPYLRTEGQCIVCTDCAGEQDTSKSASCTVEYNRPTGCYWTAAGSRGCLARLEGDCSEANSCKSCTSNNCNTAGNGAGSLSQSVGVVGLLLGLLVVLRSA